MRLPWKRLPAAILPIAVGADRDVLKNAEEPPVGDAFGDTKNFRAKFGSKTEREKGFEPSTSTLAKRNHGVSRHYSALRDQ